MERIDLRSVVVEVDGVACAMLEVGDERLPIATVPSRTLAHKDVREAFDLLVCAVAAAMTRDALGGSVTVAAGVSVPADVVPGSSEVH